MSPVASQPGDPAENPDKVETAGTGEVVELDAKSLPAFCPNPAMTLWSQHPRVYLDLAVTGSAMCPYCGTHYRLAPGSKIFGQH